MKKKRILKMIIALLCFLIVAGVIFICQEQKRKRDEWVKQEILKIDYAQQNRALPLVEGYSRWEGQYLGYDAVDIIELYVQLAAYNEHIADCKAENEVELSLADFEEYMSSELNEDGSLRIYEGYEDIRAYMNWYHEEGGDLDIAKYWGELENILGEYREQNPGVIDTDSGSMNLAQLQELIEKKNNPFYEISSEVMKGE